MFSLLVIFVISFVHLFYRVHDELSDMAGKVCHDLGVVFLVKNASLFTTCVASQSKYLLLSPVLDFVV